MSVNVVFWEHGITGQLVMGCPENFPAPPYYNKIVCRSVSDAERYSEIMRQQEQSREAMIDEEREQIEGEMIRNLRSHMHHQMANAKNAMNKDFLRIWLERQEHMVSPARMRRESYLHAEAFERGH